MKKLFLAVVLAASAVAARADAYDIKPGEASAKAAPTAVIWQGDNAKKLAAAVDCKTIAKLVETDESMAALLAKVKGAYKTDPIVATQIMEISHKVMCTKCEKAPKCRERWVAQLVKAAETSTDSYRTTFFLDQLRWCGRKADVKAVLAIGEKGCKAVKDFSEMVARELNAAE
jgi:hypothetical protein